MKIIACRVRTLFVENKKYIWMTYGLIATVVSFVAGNRDILFSFLIRNIPYLIIASISFIVLPCFIVGTTAAIWHRVRRSSKVHNDGLVLLKDTLSLLNNFRAKEDSCLQELREILNELCNITSAHFTDFTKSQTSVSIKLIAPLKVENKLELVAVNICRDVQSSDIRDSDEYDQIVHYINDNTSYFSIFDDIHSGKIGVYYLNDNVQHTPITKKRKKYRTTSLRYYSKIKGHLPDLQDLPYQSELVVPILPILPRKPTKEDVIGFFCLDSPQAFSFNAQHDLVLCQCIADAIYDLLNVSLVDEFDMED